MKRILLATRNPKKLIELREILGPDWTALSLNDLGRDLPEVEEDVGTFVGNAVKKAVWTARMAGMLTLADDSGLEVEALGFRPGVYSARFAGPKKDDLANNRLVLSLMKGKTNRRARFVCYIAVADPQGLIGVVWGEVRGRLSERMLGKEGFGYDPIFIPEGYDKTFAQLGARVKHKISHRKIALEKARDLLKIYTSPL